MATLYEITGNMKNLETLAALDEINTQCLKDTWESLSGEFEDKADAYAKVMKNLASDVETLKNEENRLAERRKSIENAIERMKRQLQEAMQTCNKPKFKTALFNFNIQKNPPKVIIDDANQIPEEYLVPQPSKINNQAIKEFLTSGNKCNFAHLEQGESLRIR